MRTMHSQSGFTVLEVLAATMIFALIFATTLQVLSGSVRNTQRSADYTEAALWAESRLASVGVEESMEIGVTTGAFNDTYRWEMEISEVEMEPPTPPAQSGDPEPGQPRATETVADQRALRQPGSPTFSNIEVPVDIYRIDLRVQWGEDRPRQISFSTLRSLTPGPDVP